MFGKLWLKVKTGSLRPYRAVVTPAVSDAVFAGATNRAAESRLAVHVALARQWERARQGIHKVPPPKRQVRQIKAGCLGFARPGHSVRRCTACKQRHRSRQIQHRGIFPLGLWALPLNLNQNSRVSYDLQTALKQHSNISIGCPKEKESKSHKVLTTALQITCKLERR